MQEVIIMLYGLIMFVPENSNPPEFLDVYLVDATKEDTIEHCTLHKHKPLITVKVDDQANCHKDCDFDVQTGYCTCTLNKHVISFDPELDETARTLRAPRTGLAQNEADASDFGWLPRIRYIGGDNDKLTLLPLDKLKEKLIGMTQVSWVDRGLSTCALMEVDLNNDFDNWVYGLTFYKFKGTSQGSRQATAEALLVNATAGKIGDNLTVKLRTFDGAAGPEIKVPCSKGGVCPVVRISNEMPKYQKDCDATECDLCYRGLDFLRYYDLFSNPPAKADRLIPQLDKVGERNKNQATCYPPALQANDLTIKFLYQGEPATSGRPICTLTLY